MNVRAILTIPNLSNPVIGRGSRASLVAVIVCAAVLAWFPVGNPDLWWHLRTGQWILHHGWPHHDPFSYTVPVESPWYDSQGLFQVVAAIIYGMGGWNGLVGLQIILTILVAFVMWIWLSERNEPPWVKTAAVVLAFSALNYRLTLRPEWFTYLFFILHLRWWDRFLRTGKLQSLGLILTQWLWSNSHSGCTLGWITGGLAVAIYLLEIGRSRFRNAAGVPSLESPPVSNTRPVESGAPVMDSNRRAFQDSPQWPRLLFTLGFMIVATFLNPNGWRQIAFGAEEASRAPIIENLPPSWFFFTGPPGGILLILLLGAGNSIRWDNLFLWLMTAVLLAAAFLHVRFFALAAVASVPITAAGWRLLFYRQPRSPDKPRLLGFSNSTAALIALGFLFVNLASGLVNDPRPLFRGGADFTGCPVAAADFIERENIRGPMYNDFNIGGYLLWRLAPERKVFIDNRTELYGPLFRRLISINSRDSFHRFLQQYNATFAILPYDLLPNDPTLSTEPQSFLSWKEWALVFWDDDAMVFLRNTPETENIIQKHSYHLIQPEWLTTFQTDRPRLDWLNSLAAAPETAAAAESELRRAIASSPRSQLAVLGLEYLQKARRNNNNTYPSP